MLDGSRLAQTVGAIASYDDARGALLGEEPIPVDVVFLDIRLAGKRDDGLELAREVSQQQERPMVVLATAFADHAIEAYDLGVADYLLKPFTEDRVEKCLRRLHGSRSAKTHSMPLRIVARRKKALVFFTPEEVWAFEAADRMTSVHTLHGTFDLDLSLNAIESSFGKCLVRVHRNWLVNAAHIKELEREGTETHVFVGESLEEQGRGVHVPVARDRAQQLRNSLLANATGLRR